MNGYAASMYDECKKKSMEMRMKIDINGESFILEKGEKSLGHFISVETLYCYLCGYEAGKSEVCRDGR